MEFWSPNLEGTRSTFPADVQKQLGKARLVVLVLQYDGLFGRIIDEPNEVACFKHYNLVVMYDGPGPGDTITGNDAYVNDPDNEVTVREVYDTTSELLEEYILGKVPADCKLHLTTTAESLMMQVAFLNRKYKLNGFQPDFTKNFVSKNDMFEIAKRVPGTLPITINFEIENTATAKEIAEGLFEQEPDLAYPLFGKPVAGYCAVGTKKIDNFDELVQYVHEMKEGKECSNYMIQEYLDGKYYVTQVFVSGDGEYHFICAATLLSSWFQMISDVSPAFNLYLTEEAEDFQSLKDYSIRLLEAYGAKSSPGLYITEVIETAPKRYKLLETMHRPDGGGSEKKLVETITGVDTEGVHIMAPFIDMKFLRKYIQDNKPEYKSGFSVWYPRKKGLVVGQKEFDMPLPEGAKVVVVKYHFQRGKYTRNPKDMSNLRCEAVVVTQSFEDSYKAAKELVEFDPAKTKDDGAAVAVVANVGMAGRYFKKFKTGMKKSSE